MRFTAEKMHAFAIFNSKYLRPQGCSDTNFTATVKHTIPKTEIKSEIIEVQVIGIQTDFVIK